MLGENTNKLVWVAIASGIVAILGVSAIVMYPSALDTSKTIITNKVDEFIGNDTSSVSQMATTFDYKFSTHDAENGYNVSEQPDAMTLMYWAQASKIDDAKSSIEDGTEYVTIGNHKLEATSLPDSFKFESSSLTGVQKSKAFDYGSGYTNSTQFDGLYTLFSYEGPNYIKEIVEAGGSFNIGDSFSISGVLTYTDVNNKTFEVPFIINVNTRD